MKSINRVLKLNLPKGQSAFLWGPRKVGKSTFLQKVYPKSIYYDFLKTDIFLEMSKKPSLLREQLLAEDEKKLQLPVILDEVQKIPNLLNEIHWLIENKNLSFILCGSSARKLKRGQSNLLGGRAWKFNMFPLVYPEIKNRGIDLIKILNRGLIPSHFLSEDYKKFLRAYNEDYLKEEVFAEGLTRNIPAFSRFFDSVGYTHGELVNFSNIARDTGVDSKTVKEYYQILVDTLLGSFVEPFSPRQGRDILQRMPKFYLFDVGVANAISRREITVLNGEIFGKAFEHYIFTELNAHSNYSGMNYPINFWRTKTGMEVDFVLNKGQVAIEVKGGSSISNKDLRGVKSFKEEYNPKRTIIVTNESKPRIVNNIELFPYELFLEKLWGGEIL